MDIGGAKRVGNGLEGMLEGNGNEGRAGSETT